MKASFCVKSKVSNKSFGPTISISSHSSKSTGSGLGDGFGITRIVTVVKLKQPVSLSVTLT